MQDIINRELGWRAFHTSLLTVFASIAIVLACIGIYAVIAFSVTQRTSEIGVRMAVGAATADILRMIVWQGAKPAVIGTLIGIVASSGISRLISQLLYGIQRTDAASYLLAVGLLAVTSVAAAYVPARRASAIDPWQALREQ
jgi:putative ABC transport system permease protein